MNLISIPAFQDNYIWVLSENNGRCIIVDPGEARRFWQPSRKTSGSPRLFY